MAQWVVLFGVVVAAAVLARAPWPTRRRDVWLLWGAWAAVSIALLVATAGLYELRKAAALCVMPLGLVWIGTGVVAVAGRRRRGGWAGALVGVWCALTVIGNAALGTVAVGLLERPYRSIDPGAVGPFDAVLVLGGGLTVAPDGSVELSDTGQRVLTGARLAREGRTEVVVASGPVLERRKGTVDYAAATASMWRKMGVPLERIVLQTGPETTSAEAAAFAELARRRGWREVGVVTSAWHLPRAMRLCRRYGLDATPVPAGFLGWWEAAGVRAVVPQARGVSLLQRFWWETVGMAVGR